MNRNRRFSVPVLFALCGLFSSAAVHANAKKDVLHELMFCSNFFNGMSQVVLAASKEKMEAVRDAFMALAVDLANSDEAALKKALTETADKAAGDVIGKKR
jgi:hypothetical protein